MTRARRAVARPPTPNLIAYDAPLDPARLARDLADVRQSVGVKPRGLWYACGDAWLRYQREHLPERAQRAAFVYEVDVDPSRMVCLRNAAQLARFQARYGVKDPDEPGWHDIDWRAVAAEYDGIEICPAQARASWYSAWDIASGCVWRLRALRGFRRVG